jgi:putative DNA primase/helicase
VRSESSRIGEDRVKSDFPNAETIARALGGQRSGRGWVAYSPCHQDGHPSLSIDEIKGKVLVKCHAGCPQSNVISKLQRRGLWARSHCGTAAIPPKGCRPIGGENSKAAMKIWGESEHVEGTLVETYLRARGITIAPSGCIRFHTGLRHSAGEIWPAMVALVTRGDAPVAIHRTFLRRDGTGKAPVDPTKMMLGPCAGGAVILGPATDSLLVGEGIETCLSAMQASGRPTWAALSTSGLRCLDLPADVQNIVVLADGDDPGEEASLHAAIRWRRQGRRVRIARPPRGLDFNDMLLGRSHADTEE